MRPTRPGVKVYGHVADIIRFFEENPGELLSLDDIAVKFELTREQAMAAANYLQRNGIVNKLRVYAFKIADSKFPGVDIDAAHRSSS